MLENSYQPAWLMTLGLTALVATIPALKYYRTPTHELPTSRASSHFNLFLRATANSKQYRNNSYYCSIPNVMYPAAGVIVASPATEPVSKPINLGFSPVPSNQQPGNAGKWCCNVRIKKRGNSYIINSKFRTCIKPYHPNQSNPVPEQPMECYEASFSNFRFPT